MTSRESSPCALASASFALPFVTTAQTVTRSAPEVAVFGEAMTSKAGLFETVDSRKPDPSQRVFAGCDELEVRRINAAANAAEMVKLKRVRCVFWRRLRREEGRAMGGDLPVTVDGEGAVSVSSARGYPKPAAAVWLRDDLVPETIGQP